MDQFEDYGSDTEDSYQVEGCYMPIQPESEIEEILSSSILDKGEDFELNSTSLFF